MNVSDTGPSSTTATAAVATSATSTAAATSYWGNARFTADGVAYLNCQRDEGVTARAEHAAQRKQLFGGMMLGVMGSRQNNLLSRHNIL
ncbi:hypothetical protein HDU78_011550 [Chytriomyces hyalinus]|nr:hypothetical protein HDU78_011550 [Chytriomyces hyalinus]